MASGLSSSNALLLFLIAVVSVFLVSLLFVSDLNTFSDKNSIPCIPRPESAFSEKVLFDFDDDNKVQDILRIGKTGFGTESNWSLLADPEAPSPPNRRASSEPQTYGIDLTTFHRKTSRYSDFESKTLDSYQES